MSILLEQGTSAHSILPVHLQRAENLLAKSRNPSPARNTKGVHLSTQWNSQVGVYVTQESVKENQIGNENRHAQLKDRQ